MMNVPLRVMSGKSPMKSCCSLISSVSFTMQLNIDPQRGRVGHILLAALELGVLGLAELVVEEAQLHAGAGEVDDRGDLVEQLAQPALLPADGVLRADEPQERIELNLDQVRYRDDLGDAAVLSTDARDGRLGRNDGPGCGHAGALLVRGKPSVGKGAAESMLRATTVGKR